MPSERFSYGGRDPLSPSALPFLPATLIGTDAQVPVSALVDSGAAINVLPYDVGLQLGYDWDANAMPISLTGNFAPSEAKALIVKAKVGRFPEVEFAFAWTTRNDIPVILGQVNFFQEFDVRFFGGRREFEIAR